MRIPNAKMKLGCFDYTFGYMPMPAGISSLSTNLYYLLNRVGLVKKHHYTRSAIEKISDLGFQGVQIMCQDAQQMPMTPKELEQLCSDTHLEIPSLGMYADFLAGDWHPERLMTIIDYAAEAGVQAVCTHSGRPREGLDNWELLAARLNFIADYSKTRDVKIAVENSPHSLVKKTGDFLQLIKLSGSVYINFDPANICIAGCDSIDAVRRLKKKIIQTHVKDCDQSGTFLPVGNGCIQYPEYLATLKRSGFHGFLIVEYEGGGNPLHAVEKSKSYLERELIRLEKNT